MKKRSQYTGTNAMARSYQDSMNYRRKQKLKANIYILAISTSFLLGFICGILIDGRG